MLVSILPCTGGPYRHEITETPMKARKKAVTWPGEHGFLDVSHTISKALLPGFVVKKCDLILNHDPCYMSLLNTPIKYTQ